MSRRQLLAAATVAPLSTMVSAEVVVPRKHVTFLLVHGAWHGGWCWKKLIPVLHAGGHQVFAPTMTGLGERSHLIAPDIDLDTHVNDVVAVLECEDLQNVVLVGHSYGGMVIAGVADKAASRVAQLVYLDAFLPEHGKSLKDYAPVPPTKADGWRVPPPGGPSSFGVTSARDIAWMEKRLGDQPLKTFTQPLRLSITNAFGLKSSFIQCTKAPFFAEAADRAKRQRFPYRALLSAGHDAMVSDPTTLAKTLLSLV